MIETIQNVILGFLRFFYIADPKSSSFKTIQEVPHYVVEAAPYFASFIFVERLILYLKGKRLPPLNDGLASVSLGLFMEVVRILMRGSETGVYIYLYNNYRIYELPWDSPVTWILAAIGVDFFYYWVHRAAHEVNLFWSQHQVHHSSEEYNFTTALRQGVFQGWFSWFFYLPMAFFVPPSHFIVHQEINLLYQFWIHTELIDNLGPLEYIFNTPSHHRVHHGSNKYCIDKNYAGVLIVWDRMFGTFVAEKKNENIVYGLIDQVESFNPFYLQTFYLVKVYEKMKSVTGFWNKMAAVFYGPGWSPGTPRTGFEHLLPDIKERKKYQQPISRFLVCFMLSHFAVLSLGYQYLGLMDRISNVQMFFSVAYIIASLTSMGFVYDNKPWASYTEFARCLLFVWYSFHAAETITDSSTFALIVALRVFFTASAFFWFHQLSTSTGKHILKNHKLE